MQDQKSPLPQPVQVSAMGNNINGEEAGVGDEGGGGGAGGFKEEVAR